MNDLFVTTHNCLSSCYYYHVMMHCNQKLRKALTLCKFYSDKRGFSFLLFYIFLCYSYKQVALICVLPQSEDSYKFQFPIKTWSYNDYHRIRGQDSVVCDTFRKNLLPVSSEWKEADFSSGNSVHIYWIIQCDVPEGSNHQDKMIFILRESKPLFFTHFAGRT